MKMVLTGCEALILREVDDSRMKRKDVAQTYRLCMESTEAIDWKKVNAAIMERWSMSGLIWIKKQAHSGRCFED